MKLRLHRLAIDEIDHEVDYYESRQPGLGTLLEDEIDDVLDVILRFPKAVRNGSTARTDASPRSIASRSRSPTRSTVTT